MKNAAARAYHEEPELVIEPGRRYRMRNGHLARVLRQDNAIVNGKSYPYWFGHCLDCASKITWQISGRYSATGSAPHPYDLVVPA